MTLEETVAFMRKNKMLHLKTAEGLEISLEPLSDDLPPQHRDGPDLDEVGLTGMTRRQQIDLFGDFIKEDFDQRP